MRLIDAAPTIETRPENPPLESGRDRTVGNGDRSGFCADAERKSSD